MKKLILPVAQRRLVLRNQAEWETAHGKAEQTGSKPCRFARTWRTDLVPGPESLRARRLRAGPIERMAAVAQHGRLWG